MLLMKKYIKLALWHKLCELSMFFVVPFLYLCVMQYTTFHVTSNMRRNGSTSLDRKKKKQGCTMILTIYMNIVIDVIYAYTLVACYLNSRYAKDYDIIKG